MFSSMKHKKIVTILGATGSVGQNTVDVICKNPESFEVYAVTANENVELLAATAIKVGAKLAVIANQNLENDLIKLLADSDIKAQSGSNAINKCAAHNADVVMCAIVGFAGLRPLIYAIENGNNVAVANKEPLAAAGEFITKLVKENGVKILPVDSEHNAIFQVFENNNKGQVYKLILTASGGPFLDWSKEEIDKATPDQALNHPNWSMGAKISIDSATMMNKALEIIEAAYLFDLPSEQIDVVIHRQSIIHSMVSYKDGSMLAQLGQSDMRTPIASALAWPDRLDMGGDRLDVYELSKLTFEKPDLVKFPALKYAYKCLELGQSACITLNASNEVAVAAFLEKRISFGDIMKCNIYAIDNLYPKLAYYELKTIEDVENLDQTVHLAIKEYIVTKLTPKG